jgi:hypothetical protein
MNMTTGKVYVSLNGETIEATGELLTEVLKNQADAQADAQAEAAAKAAKESSKAALLNRLGITPDEAALLLG